MTVAIHVELDEKKEQILRQEAERRGVKVSDYARQLIESQIPGSNRDRTLSPTLSLTEMQDLVQQDFEKLGMSDQEFDDLVDDVVHRIRAEQQGS